MPEPSATVDLQPIGRRAVVAPGATVLDAARQSGVALVSVCGGAGSCATCRVRHAAGALAPPTLTEYAELGEAAVAAGWRLACQAAVTGDVRIELPPESLAAPQRLQLEGEGVAGALDPPVTPIDVAVPPPDLYDLRADDARLADALRHGGHGALRLGRAVLAELPATLREHEWRVRLAVRQSDGSPFPEVAGALAPGTALLGLAVDIGTTKVAAYLVDLADGAVLARAGAANPQIAYGEDVVARIAYATRGVQEAATLRGRLAETIDGLAGELCRLAGARREQVADVVAVGNTAMHHLFVGLPVRQLGEAPYVPAVAGALDIPASELGLRLAPGCSVHLPPNIAGYVGADHVAMLLGAGVERAAATVLALDIGTNTEVSLARGGRLVSCSCASGPAFEGAHIRDGMRAASGAIERVQLIDGTLRLATIDGAPAAGICGSGILDAVAALRAAGVLDRRGAMDTARPGVRGRGGAAEFVLAPADDTAHGRDVGMTRADVHEVQLAKAAIRAGCEILLATAGVAAAELDAVIVAGAFGTYLDLRSALAIGMLPSLPPERFRQVGNAAGAGAIRMLVSAAARRSALEVARRAEYVELTTHPAFTDVFTESLFL